MTEIHYLSLTEILDPVFALISSFSTLLGPYSALKSIEDHDGERKFSSNILLLLDCINSEGEPGILYLQDMIENMTKSIGTGMCSSVNFTALLARETQLLHNKGVQSHVIRKYLSFSGDICSQAISFFAIPLSHIEHSKREKIIETQSINEKGLLESATVISKTANGNEDEFDWGLPDDEILIDSVVMDNNNDSNNYRNYNMNFIQDQNQSLNSVPPLFSPSDLLLEIPDDSLWFFEDENKDFNSSVYKLTPANDTLRNISPSQKDINILDEFDIATKKYIYENNLALSNTSIHESAINEINGGISNDLSENVDVVKKENVKLLKQLGLALQHRVNDDEGLCVEMNLAVECMLKLLDGGSLCQEGGVQNIDLSCILPLKMNCSGSANRSCVVEGIVIDVDLIDRSQMYLALQRHREKGEEKEICLASVENLQVEEEKFLCTVKGIALIHGDVSKHASSSQVAAELESKSFSDSYMIKWIEALQLAQVSLVFCGGFADDVFKDLAAENGILVIGGITRTHLESISILTGGVILSDLMSISKLNCGSGVQLSWWDFGWRKDSEKTVLPLNIEKNNGHDVDLFIRIQIINNNQVRSFINNPISVLFAGSTSSMIEELESRFWKCLYRLKSTLSSQLLCHGGGVCELICAAVLEYNANEIEKVNSDSESFMSTSDTSCFAPLVMRHYAKSLKDLVSKPLLNCGIPFQKVYQDIDTFIEKISNSRWSTNNNKNSNNESNKNNIYFPFDIIEKVPELHVEGDGPVMNDFIATQAIFERSTSLINLLIRCDLAIVSVKKETK